MAKKKRTTRLANRAQGQAAEILMTAEVYKLYKQTICQHPPETYALLGGSLDDPFTITEFRFCPPERDSAGRYNAGTAHVGCDAEYMNFVIDHEWRPIGKDMLGIWHSHPGNCTGLSQGDKRTNDGDIAFFSTCMEHDDSPKQNWNNFLAPITTFKGRGDDIVTPWILRKGATQPEQAVLKVLNNTRVRQKAPKPSDVIPNQAPTVAILSDSVNRQDVSVRLNKIRDIKKVYEKEWVAMAKNPNINDSAKQQFFDAMMRCQEADLTDAYFTARYEAYL